MWKETVVISFKVLSWNFLERTGKTNEYLSYDSCIPDRGLKPGPREYEAVVLKTRPRRSVTTVRFSDIYVC
jgi:hypothetical protein